MCTRPLALSVLVGSVALGCASRTDFMGSPGDAGKDASATEGAGSAVDGTATVDARVMADVDATSAETIGAACKLPAGALPDMATPGACTPVRTGLSCSDKGCQPFCDSAHVEMICSRAEPWPSPPTRPDIPSPPLGCDVIPIPTPENLLLYCCPCEGTDAGAAVESGVDTDGGDSGVVCINVDPSTYDQSCETPTDCVFIASGTICKDRCTCVKALVNVGEQARAEQALAPLGSRPTCDGCTRFPQYDPSCVQGKCGLPQ